MQGNQENLEYGDAVRVPMVEGAADPATAKRRWTASHAFMGIGVFGYYFEAEIGGKCYLYQNNRDALYQTRETGLNGLGVVEEKTGDEQAIRRYRLTVYRPDYTVPAWAADAIYYYIFPERFRNGDPANDPKVGVDSFHDLPIELHGNWLDKPYRANSGDGSDDCNNNDFFGGDIAGIIEKLDYIADLGANVLYITPLFTASSNHKYDTADYRNIDPRFGSNEDFSRLTVEAGRRGIRVIPDVSLNHTGSDSIYFDRYAKYEGLGAFDGGRIQADSPYADWYLFDSSQADPDKQYQGWIGVVGLPELNKSSPGFRQFAYGADDSVMKLWLDRGAAGWRMDVAPWVPDDFWREWRTAIKHHRPDALTIAETWFDSSKFFLGDTFDSTMNYIFRDAVLAYANGGDARTIYPNIEYIREVYPPQSFHALMNLLSSHDVERSLHIFGYQDDNDAPERIRHAKRRQRLAVFFQMIFPGAPAVYYGDEVGLTGGKDPYNRACYPWADRGGEPDLELLAEVKRLIAMRRENPVLSRGSLSAPVHLDEHVIVLVRRDGECWAITATNNAPTPVTVTVELPVELAATAFEDALAHTKIRSNAGSLTFTVPAEFGTVLVSR